jgi:hypothetical protein
LDLLLSLFPEETEKWQSRFERERKAKEADCIIAERSCRFFIVFLLPKELPRRGTLGLCLSSGKTKNPGNPVDPV